MFLPVNLTLGADLDTDDTLVLAGKYDVFRFSSAGHVLLDRTGDDRYTAPTDFTLACDGNGDVTLTWLHASTIPNGSVILLGIAYIDQVAGGGVTGTGGGGGSFDPAVAADIAQMAADIATIKNDTSPAPVTTVKEDIRLVDVTLTTDTAIYAVDEVLAATQLVAGAFKEVDGTGIVVSATLIDKADQGVAIDIFLLNANVSFGAENAAATSLTDSDAEAVMAKIEILATDYEDFGGVKVAFIKNLEAIIKAAAGTDDCYVVAIVRSGTPTYAGGTDLVLRLGILC